MADLAVIILTQNEEIHLARAIEKVGAIAKEIFVVDSFSTDRTVEIARAHGAVVLQNKFINYAKQFQWALDNAPITAEWIMRLDADEIVEADLAIEVNMKLDKLPSEFVGINLKRKHIFLDRWIRYGGRYPLVLLRIWRRGNGRIEDRWMDEHIVVRGGQVLTFAGGFADHNLKDITFFVDKHNKYATREAIDVLSERLNLSRGSEELTVAGTSQQTFATRFLKTRVYNRLPFPIGVFSYFFYRYFIQLGFLDGIEGMIYHFLQGFWYRFLVGAKIIEYEKAIKSMNNPKDIMLELSRLTGHQLSASSQEPTEG